MSLKEYVRKRNFGKTPEPDDRKTAKPKSKAKTGLRFVIQKHDASRLHYDFRLEQDGVLKSWAVPKGVPYVKGEKRLAVQTEDHPLAYIDFEGTIPEGQYGGGTVMVWDQGTYEPLSDNPSKELAGGKLHVILQGSKLHGEWYLVQLREGNQWLLIKGGEDMKVVSKKQEDTSVLSGQSMKELAKGDRVWQSKETHGKTEAEAKASGRTKKNSRSTPAPLPDFIEPMKAKLALAAPKGDWTYEIKFDGFRALALKGGSQARLLSRNEKDLGGKFPELMESILALPAEDAIVDGEIVALDEKGRSSFQLLQARELDQERPPLLFYAFDLLQLNGENLMGLPLEARKEKLAALLKGEEKSGLVRFSAGLDSDLKELLKQVRELGLEGLIGKRKGSLYESGQRSGTWIKLKLQQEQEFVIGGYTDPEGSRQNIGALLVGVYEKKRLIYCGKVGTGFNVKLLRSLHQSFKKIATDECPFANLPEKRAGRWGQGITPAEFRRCHWVEPKMVCQVKYAEWTRDDRLRQPVFLGLREDKDAKEVIREKAT